MALYIGLVLIVYLLISIGLSSLFVYLFKGKKEFKKHLLDVFLVFTTITTWLIFFVGLSNLSEPFYKAIDPVDFDYQPFSQSHILSLFLYLLLGFISVYSIWKKGKQIPPLLLVIYVSILIVDFVICFEMILQLSSRFDDGLYIDESIGHFLIIAPLNFIIISVLLLVKLIKEERVISNKRDYKNHILNFLNEKLKHSNKISIWTFIILLPFYLAITLILILFGQDVDSLVKVFTDTTTWFYSQKAHPPYLDHKGHYLCTVAACGSPGIVKPIRLGVRNGEEIIVNRQLLIANAFEDLIQTKSPIFHKLIRTNYDKYGYPLSKRINNVLWSNITYFLMKPIELLFLVFIYLFSNEPEKLIKSQYSINKS